MSDKTLFQGLKGVKSKGLWEVNRTNLLRRDELQRTFQLGSSGQQHRAVIGSSFRVEGPDLVQPPAQSLASWDQVLRGFVQLGHESLQVWILHSLCSAPSTACLTSWQKGFPLFLTWIFRISDSICCPLFSHHTPLWITWLWLLLASCWVWRGCHQSLLPWGPLAPSHRADGHCGSPCHSAYTAVLLSRLRAGTGASQDSAGADPWYPMGCWHQDRQNGSLWAASLLSSPFKGCGCFWWPSAGSSARSWCCWLALAFTADSWVNSVVLLISGINTEKY